MPPSKLIQIDIDPQEIGKIYPVEIGIVGDAKPTLRELVRHLRGMKPAPSPARAAAIAKRKRDWQDELKDSQHDSEKPIHPARLLMELSTAAPPDAIFVTSVGRRRSGTVGPGGEVLQEIRIRREQRPILCRNAPR